MMEKGDWCDGDGYANAVHNLSYKYSRRLSLLGENDGFTLTQEEVHFTLQTQENCLAIHDDANARWERPSYCNIIAVC
jgi:hypothetical protein